MEYQHFYIREKIYLLGTEAEVEKDLFFTLYVLELIKVNLSKIGGFSLAYRTSY